MNSVSAQTPFKGSIRSQFCTFSHFIFTQLFNQVCTINTLSWTWILSQLKYVSQVKQGHKFQILSFHFILFHYLPWSVLSQGCVHHVHSFLFVNVSGIIPPIQPHFLHSFYLVLNNHRCKTLDHSIEVSSSLLSWNL
jgi:hypothetical protein